MSSSIKENLKKNPVVSPIHKAWKKTEHWMLRELSGIAPKFVSRIHYERTFGKKLDLENPKTLNEKSMWLKLYKYADDPVVMQCSDKYAVREFVEKCGLSHILNELYGAWDRVEDVPWDTFPERFAIKCNHGCGQNLICTDKSKLDVKKAEELLRVWLKDSYWKEYAEIQYRKIKRKIICEKYLEGKGDALPVDYKFYCINGEPVYIGNFIERNIEKDSLIRGYFDINWQPSTLFRFKTEAEKFPRPACLEEMIEYSRILSKPFPFVRVDFYEVDGKVYFGELTFTPSGCLGTYYTDEAELELGEALHV